MKYKVRWNNGMVEDNVEIEDGAQYTWEDVDEILHTYPDEPKEAVNVVEAPLTEEEVANRMRRVRSVQAARSDGRVSW